MLLLALVMPLASLDLIIYDGGDPVTITQGDVDSDDDLIVRGGPPNMTDTTLLYMTEMTEVQSVTAERGGSVWIEDSSRVLTNVTIESGGGCHLTDLATVAGSLEIRTGGAASFATMGTIGSLRVDQGGDLTSSALATVLHDATIMGKAYFNTVTIRGTTSFRSSRRCTATGTTFEGPVELSATAHLEADLAEFHGVVRLTDASQGEFANSTLHGDLVLEDMSRARFLAGNTFSGVLDLRDSSTAGLVVLSSNYPDGAILDLFGVITGTDLDGMPLSIPFVREAGTELVVAIYSSSIGTNLCAQPFTNSLGLFAQITAAGSDLAAAGFLELTASNLPNQSFGYFVVGTQQGLVITPVGDVCVGGNIGRFIGPGQIMYTGSNGSYTLAILGPIPGNPATTAVAGSTYIFQSWNREPFFNPPYNSRFSNALSVLFR